MPRHPFDLRLLFFERLARNSPYYVHIGRYLNQLELCRVYQPKSSKFLIFFESSGRRDQSFGHVDVFLVSKT